MTVESGTQGMETAQTSQPVVEQTTESSSVGTGSPGASEAPIGGSGDVQGSTPAAYVLNPEFSSFGEKKKFDEWALPLIKDPDTEAKFRDLFQAKYSIDRVKAKRDEYQTQFSSVQKEHSQLSRQVERWGGYIQSGDLATLQREVGISDDHILRRAQQIFAEKENPALRQAADHAYSESERARQLEEQNSYYQEQYFATAAKQRETELDQALGRSDIAQVVSAFDTRAGQPGAFRDQVIQRGIYYATAMKKDVSVDDILKELVPMFNIPQTTAPQIAPPQVAPNGVIAADAPAAPDRKPVIPNVRGNGSSPAPRKTYKSLDDLRARGKELAQQNR